VGWSIDRGGSHRRCPDRACHRDNDPARAVCPGLAMLMLPVILTLILCTGAVLVFALVGRFAKNPVRTYLIIAAIFLVISFLPDLAAVSAPFPGAGWPYSITLMIMHVMAGFITVSMLIKLTVNSNQ
jgi:uncharacterized protein DUF6069